MAQPHVVEIAIEPKRASDLAKLLIALDDLARSKAIAFSHDRETGQTILKGGSEDDLDAAIAILRNDRGIATDIGALQVAYRETLARRVEIDETYKRQTGGSGQFAKVRMLFEPTQRGAGASYAERIVGGAVPEAYLPGVEAGIAAVMKAGILAGFPVVDVSVMLIDGAYHDSDSSALAFEIAARAAFRRALKEGGSILLEPVMTVEVTTPEDYVGFVVGDLGARRGEVLGRHVRGATVAIDATVPLSNLFGYASQLRSGTRGSASFTMRFSHYAPLPSPPDDGPSAPAVALRA